MKKNLKNNDQAYKNIDNMRVKIKLNSTKYNKIN